MNFQDKIVKLLPNDTELGFIIFDLKTKDYIMKMNEAKSFPLASISIFISVAVALKEETEIDFPVIHKAIATHCHDSYYSILDNFPVENVNQVIRELGLDLAIDDDYQHILANVGTPAALASFLELLAGDFIENDDHRNAVFHALAKQQDADGFRFSKELEWWHMTGGLEGVCLDIGFLHERYICVGCLQANKPMVWSELAQTLRKMGAVIEDHLIK